MDDTAVGRKTAAGSDAGAGSDTPPGPDAGPDAGAGGGSPDGDRRPAAAGPGGGAAGGGAAAARRWRPRLSLRQSVTGGLAVAAAALAVATGLLAVAMHGQADAARQRAAALSAARQEAVALTTVDRRSGARDFAALLAGSAGSLRQQLAQGRGAFLSTLSSAAVSSAGTVLDAGIVSIGPRSATVLLNVRAVVRNSQTYRPEARLYHWQAGLVYSGGRWLVSSLEFV